MNYYKKIKNELLNNEIYKRVKNYSKNSNDLKTYYNVGKLLVEAGNNYGEGIIKDYSIKLTNELGKGYTSSALKRMRQFYWITEKGATLSHYLLWSHYAELLVIQDINKINYYIKITEEQNLSVRELRTKIKSNEYERLDDKTKQKLIKYEQNEVQDFIKNPIIIRTNDIREKITEKVLKEIILDDISSFLKEFIVLLFN